MPSPHWRSWTNLGAAMFLLMQPDHTCCHEHDRECKAVWLQTTQPASGEAVSADSRCCANSVEPTRPNNGGQINRFEACRPCGPAGWLALLLTKAGDVETNPGPTTLNKQVWICDICHKQIHVRKQISIRCNRI